MTTFMGKMMIDQQVYRYLVDEKHEFE